jgi:hypothetical protein
MTLNSNLYLHREAFSKDSLTRRGYYDKLYEDYQGLITLRQMLRDESVNMSLLGLDVYEDINQALDKFVSNIRELEDSFSMNLQTILTDSEQTYEHLQVAIDSLATIVDLFSSDQIGADARHKISVLDISMENKLTAIRDEMYRESEQISLTDKLCMLQMLYIRVPRYKEHVDQTIDDVLNEVLFRRRSLNVSQMFTLLSTAPNTKLRSYGMMLSQERNIFKTFILDQRNKATSEVTVENVLSTLSENKNNVNLKIDSLRHYYELFSCDTDDEQLESKEETKQQRRHPDSAIDMPQGLYWKLVSEGYMDTESQLQAIVDQTREFLGSQQKTPYKVKVMSLVSYVFAYWTLAEYMERQKNPSETTSVDPTTLLQPHSAQVLSIFRLLGMDAGSERDSLGSIVENHFIEIGTGEGKSITLAVASCVFALLGFDVDCACYSSYLSKRDYDAFFHVFRAFRVEDQIEYGTFNQLCENMINADGDIREMVQAKAEGRRVSRSKGGSSGNKKVILIDEVDVFFSKEFYGQSYCPITKIRHETVTQLLQYIWDNRTDRSKISLDMMKASAVYQACLQHFRSWEPLLEECLKGMLVDVASFDEHTYEVEVDESDGLRKIGYPDQHGLSFSMFHRYKTVFAYMHESKSGDIPVDQAEEHIALIVHTGFFSYSEIPKRYRFMMGLTGTLSTLSDVEMEVLRTEYGIHKFTYMPSMFSKQAKFYVGNSPAYNTVCENGHFFEKLRNAIKFWMENQAKTSYTGFLGLGREVDQADENATTDSRRSNGAVLVVFESKDVLKAFNAFMIKDLSLRINGHEPDFVTLTDENTVDEKNTIIKTAASPGKITVCSREFGRGTDFISYDKELDDSGGLHVIQAFISTMLSEETQIRGRTARQSNKGSCSLVVNHGHLDYIGMKEEDIDAIGTNYYTHISNFRSSFFQAQYEASKQNIKDAQDRHSKSEEFVNRLKGNGSGYLDYLVDTNRVHYNQGTTCKKIICLMDATGSMSSALEKAKARVHEMFRRVYHILEDRQVSDGFELQFAAYRNYNVDASMILQHSNWESDAGNLESFLEGVKPQGGWGREAIEVGFAYVNHLIQEGQEISQVILIGDMPPNTAEEVVSKRQSKGENYWQNSRKPYLTHSTFYQDELQHILDRSIPINTFYIGDSARDSFEDIATRSGGQASQLDVNSESGAEELTGIVSRCILEATGGEDLVQAYEATDWSVVGHA